MHAVSELKKEIETGKEALEHQRQDYLKEKSAINELLLVSQERTKTLQERVSELATESADVAQQLQTQRSRADVAQVRMTVHSHGMHAEEPGPLTGTVRS